MLIALKKHKLHSLQPQQQAETSPLAKTKSEMCTKSTVVRQVGTDILGHRMKLPFGTHFELHDSSVQGGDQRGVRRIRAYSTFTKAPCAKQTTIGGTQ